MQLCTKDMGNPWSRNARSDAKSRPAPESAIHSSWNESGIFALSATLLLCDTTAGDAHRAAECADNCGWPMHENKDANAMNGRTNARSDACNTSHPEPLEAQVCEADETAEAPDTPCAAAITATVALALLVAAVAFGFAAGFAFGSWKKGQLSPLLHVPFG